MHSMNHVFLMGHLTRDPQLRTLPSGTAVADLGLAVNERYKDKDGNWVERPTFVDNVVWGKQAQNCAEFLKKGSPVLVEGKLQLDQWETESGDKRSRLRVRAWRIQFLSTSNGKAGADADSTSDREPAHALAADSADDDMPF